MAALVTDQALRRLLDAGRAVASTLELEPVLEQLSATAKDVIGARHAAMERLDEHAGTGPEELGAPIVVEGRLWGHLRVSDKTGGTPFTEADEQAATHLAGWAAIAIVIARRRRELATTIDIARALGGETDLQRILDLIVHRGLELLDARGALILLREPGGSRVAAVAGQTPARYDGARLGSGSGRVVDALGLAAHDGTVTPLVFRGRTLGMLVVLGDGRPSERTLVNSFAVSAATAVATARTVEERRLRDTMHAAEEERRRWARELHDTTLQGLGGLRMLITAGSRAQDPELARTILRRAMSRLEEEIADLRELVRELRPAALDELGLAAAVEGLATRTADREHIAVSAAVSLTRPRYDPDLETAVYRILQEATTNAVRHAGAEHVTLSLTEDDGALHVCVTDDGRGFDPHAPAEGYGLLGMRERVTLLRGELQITSSAEGTAVAAALPLDLTAAGRGWP